MSQTDQSIKPALTPEEWARVVGYDTRDRDLIERQLNTTRDTHLKVALANYLLPDDDPRKITREMVNIIREAGRRIGREGNPYLGFEENLTRYADILAALLPPE